jgi:Ras-related protein Rab-1A
VCLLGNCGVGKSSLLQRITENTFLDTSLVVEFKVRTLDLDGKRIKLQIMDSNGLDKFRIQTISSDNLVQHAHGFIFVYDVTNPESLSKAPHWLREIQHAGKKPAILLGNKSDLVSDKRIELESTQELANGVGIPFFEVSAKSGANVEEAIVTLTRNLIQSVIDPNEVANPSVPVESHKCVCQ